MKVIIDIPYHIYEMVTNTGTFGYYHFDTRKAIRNGTPIPDNATNGEVFSVIYKNVSRIGTVLMDDMENIIATNVNIGWWNYQKGGKENG